MTELGAELRFWVPLPPQELSPNNSYRHSWGPVASAKKGYKNAVRVLAIAEARKTGWRPPARARVSLLAGTARHPLMGTSDRCYRPRDHGNLISAFKAGFDGLVAAGLLIDDDADHMELWRVAIDSKGGPGIEVVLVEEVRMGRL